LLLTNHGVGVSRHSRDRLFQPYALNLTHETNLSAKSITHEHVLSHQPCRQLSTRLNLSARSHVLEAGRV